MIVIESNGISMTKTIKIDLGNNGVMIEMVINRSIDLVSNGIMRILINREIR